MKKILAFIFALALLAVPVAADSEYGYGYVDSGFDFPTSTGNPNEAGRMFSAELPMSYDLRDETRVSPVRDQGSYGTCWAFASLASMESNLLTQEYTDIDLSERHLVYFTYNHQDIANPEKPYPGLEGIAGDFLTPIRSYMDNGGNILMSSMTLASGIGAADESSAPYDDIGVSLSADLATNVNTFQVKNIYWVSKNNTDTIKQYIMEKGAGTVAYYSSASNSTYCKHLEGNTYAYYVSDKDETFANHMVTLIGWDDTFSADNFATRPAGDGAWLIQNSWGNHHTYLWISYYDTSLCDFGFFETGLPEYDSIYQYDGTALPAWWSFNDLDSLSMANVYTAESDEDLNAVSFFILDADVTYTVKIYKGVSVGDPESGVCVTSHTGFRGDAGYVYVPLARSVPLTEGDCFSVVITIDPKENGVSYFKDTSHSLSWLSTDTYANPGQSYLNTGGYWNDLSSDGKTNLRIKAFTTDADSPEPLYPGKGTENDPYIITTPEQLDNIRYNPDACYRLDANIDLSSYSSFEPIGNASYSYFSGSFDGNGHTVSHLTINSPDTPYLGLFGYIKGGAVTNLTLSNVSITGDYVLGSLAGFVEDGSVIQNCVVEGAAILGNSECGGLAGWIVNGNTIDSCSVAAAVTAANNISGGLAGGVENGNLIQDCTVIADVSVGLCAAGGVIGMLYCDNAVETEPNTIQNCAVISVVDGGWSLGGFAGEICGEQKISQSSAVSVVTGWDSLAGGFVGWAYDDYQSGASISDSYAYASVDAPYGAGGFAGEFSKGKITHVYSTGFVNATQYAGGLVGWLGSSASLTNSFALPLLVNGTADINRVVGHLDGASISQCYAFDRMLNLAGDFTVTENSGSSPAGLSLDSTELWESTKRFSSAGFDFSTIWKMNATNADYLLPELVNTPLLQPDIRNASYLKPVVIPDGSTGTELSNTVASCNAETAVEISYLIHTKDAESYSVAAPTVTNDFHSIRLNETVLVTAHYGWAESTLPALLNEDGTYSVPDENLSGVVYLTITFQGRKLGDVTADGIPDTLDAARVLQASVGLYEFSNADTFYGDVSGDGEVNTFDAARILQYSVGLVDENYMMKA